MEFSGSQPIYLQIGDYICENILSGKWKEGERIPSVRDLAIEIAVNPNTVMRTYAMLQEKQIIVNQRGIGFFVAEKGLEKTIAYMIKHFFEVDLKNVFKMMDILHIGIDEIQESYAKRNTKS